MDRNLYALIKVVETGNLSAAAEEIGLAQPSLSKRLKQLEEEYQTKLFERHPHGMVPTEFGNTLFLHAKKIQQQHLQADEAINAKKAGKLDIIRVGAGPVVRSYLMRPLIDELRKEYLDIRFEFREEVHIRNMPFLKNGELDVVFGAVSGDEELGEIESFQMATLTLGMLAHESHSLFKKKTVTAKDLLDIPWVHHSDDGVAGKMIEGYYARNGLLVPKSSVRTTSLEFGMELVSTSAHIMPAAIELTRAFQSFGIKSLPLAEPIDHFPIGAYVRRSSLSFPAIHRLIQIATKLANTQKLDLI